LVTQRDRGGRRLGKVLALAVVAATERAHCPTAADLTPRKSSSADVTITG
jgi:hypothetical protein